MESTKLFYYLADDPNKEIFCKDVSEGVEVLPALAVVSTSYFQIAKAKATAQVRTEDFKRKITDEIFKTLEIVKGIE